MESLSKNKLSDDQINILTKHAFGKVTMEIIENNIGEFSALYMIKIADKEIVLKVAPKDTVKVLRYERNTMQKEIEALKLVKKNTNVPVPEVLFYDSTKALCDSEYFFMEKVNGTNYDLLSSECSTEQNNNIMFQVGKLNRQINNINNSKFGCLVQSGNQNENWKTIFNNLVSDILNDSKDLEIELPVSYDDIEKIIKSFSYVCEEVQTPRLIHWDLWRGNVLVHDGKITGIIDFERALYADYLMEHLFRFSSKENNEFYKGYGVDALSLDINSQIRLRLYDLYLALIYVIEYYYRKYDQSHYEWRARSLISACKAFEAL